jgi:Zinc knuckle
MTQPNHTQATTTVSNIPSDIGLHTLAQAGRPASTASTASPRIIPGSDGVLHNTVTYFTCNRSGHYASNCPEPTGVTLV